jgi:hypothetical protein
MLYSVIASPSPGHRAAIIDFIRERGMLGLESRGDE